MNTVATWFLLVCAIFIEGHLESIAKSLAIIAAAHP